MKIRAFNHLLGECGVTIFATAALARSLGRDFPSCLEGAPFLLPAGGTTLRRSLDQWFEARRIRPRILGEMEDSALVQVFGATGAGAFPAPSAIEEEIRRQHGVRILGRLEDVRESFYAVSVERKLRNPAILAISESARSGLFCPG
jgi:LysR family transcriptional activator of nhaA